MNREMRELTNEDLVLAGDVLGGAVLEGWQPCFQTPTHLLLPLPDGVVGRLRLA